ncbi:MAG: hypothetical protein Q7T71_17735, partial [Herbiconiux sp.]|nr:hypothetical protein [Herbiconiux sp.]
MRSRRTMRLSLAATAVAAAITVFPVASALASASPSVTAIAAPAVAGAPSEVIIPTAPPEPEPTEEPPTPEPTEEPPAPEPTEEPPVPEPTDEAPIPVPVPVPVEVPAEPVAPVEVPTEEPEDFFVDDDDADEAPVEEAPAPVVTPTPTPTPSATPIPAIDIFAPFYPPSNGPVRDLMPLIFGGVAAAAMVLAAIASFIVSRFRLARLRAMTAVSFRPSGTAAPLAPRVTGKTPRNLDISVLIAASPQPVKVPAERLLDWHAGPRPVSAVAQPAASLSLHLPVRSTTPTGAKRPAADFSVPSLGETRPAGRRRREGASGAASRFTLAGLLAPRAPK